MLPPPRQCDICKFYSSDFIPNETDGELCDVEWCDKGHVLYKWEHCKDFKYYGDEYYND